jgi:hypothetical protein
LGDKLFNYFKQHQDEKPFFEEIMGIRNDIAIRKDELTKLKHSQLTGFNKRYKLNSNVSYYELVKAALFGNRT